MKEYNDFRYVEYILNSSFIVGFKLYSKCIQGINERKDNEVKDKIRDLWLIEIQHGYKHDFETYYKSKLTISENNNLGYDFRTTEEQRIIKDIDSKKNKKLVETRFKL